MCTDSLAVFLLHNIMLRRGKQDFPCGLLRHCVKQPPPMCCGQRLEGDLGQAHLPPLLCRCESTTTYTRVEHTHLTHVRFPTRKPLLHLLCANPSPLPFLSPRPPLYLRGSTLLRNVRQSPRSRSLTDASRQPPVTPH